MLQGSMTKLNFTCLWQFFNSCWRSFEAWWMPYGWKVYFGAAKEWFEAEWHNNKKIFAKCHGDGNGTWWFYKCCAASYCHSSVNLWLCQTQSLDLFSSTMCMSTLWCTWMFRWGCVHTTDAHVCSYHICTHGYSEGGDWRNMLFIAISVHRSVGVNLTLEDFQRVSDEVPLLADLKPSGKYVMEDLHKVKS